MNPQARPHRGRVWHQVAWLVVLGFAAAHAAEARSLEVGPGRPFAAPSAAAAAARDGDNIVIAPGTYADCAVWRPRRLVIEGVGGDPAATVVTGPPCQGAALFVTVGDNITVRNLTLTGAHVPDHNGAGIRMEGRDLTVERVRFVDNENGILTSTAGSSLVVRDSLFLRNGLCMPICAHGIYAGALDLLRVVRSQFRETHQGHHIKSRASRTEVLDSDITDGDDGTASYLIDIPNGGAVLIRGNTLEKGPCSENHTAAIMIGAEGVTRPTPEILIEYNAFRFKGGYLPIFVDNRTSVAAVLRGNSIPPLVPPLHGEGTVR